MNKDHEKYIPLSTVKGRSKVENLHGHIAINKANIPSTWKRTQATSAISGFILPPLSKEEVSHSLWVTFVIPAQEICKNWYEKTKLPWNNPGKCSHFRWTFNRSQFRVYDNVPKLTAVICKKYLNVLSQGNLQLTVWSS